MLLNSNRTVEKQAEKRSGRACRRLDYQTEEIVRLALRVVGFRMIGRTRPLDGGPVEETGGDFRAVEPGTGRIADAMNQQTLERFQRELKRRLRYRIAAFLLEKQIGFLELRFLHTINKLQRHYGTENRTQTARRPGGRT